MKRPHQWHKTQEKGIDGESEVRRKTLPLGEATQVMDGASEDEGGYRGGLRHVQER